jgi:transcriptional regulator with XRE-family HTH domain
MREANERKSLMLHMRKLRKERGLSLENISVMTGLSTAHLSKIENGLRQPGLDTFLMYSKAIGCRLEVWES